MATPEAKVKNAVKKVLKEYGIWYYMPVQNGMGVVGIPDFVGCWNGWFVGIECKAPGKLTNLTINQVRRLDEIEKAQGLALVIDNADALRQILDNLLKMKQEVDSASQKIEVKES